MISNSNRQRRNTIPAAAISNYAGGSGVANFSGAGSSISPGISDPIDYEQIINWPDVENEVIKSDGSSGPVEIPEINWPGTASEVIRGDGSNGPVTAAMVDFAGLPWQALTSSLRLVQEAATPFMVQAATSWNLYRINFGAVAFENSYTPTNSSPSTESYGAAVSESGTASGAWWSHRLARPSGGNFPTSSTEDVFIFPQDFGFSSTPPGSLFVAVRAGSAWDTRISGGASYNFMTFGRVGSNWMLRTHTLSAPTSLGTVSAYELANGVITTAKLADSAVTAGKIQDSAVTSAKILNGAVGTTKLADLAVTNAKIANATIGSEKLAFDWQLLKSVIEVNTTLDSGFTARPSSNGAITYRNLILQPRGVGAIQSAPGDGSAANGNIRGSYAVDLQLFREFAFCVAAGNYSVLIGGRNSEITDAAPYSSAIGAYQAELLYQNIFAHGNWPIGYNRHSYIHGYNNHYYTVRVPLSKNMSDVSSDDGWTAIRPFDAPTGENGFKIYRSGGRLPDPGDGIVYARIFWLKRNIDSVVFVDSIAIDHTQDVSSRVWARHTIDTVGGGTKLRAQAEGRIRFTDSDTFQVEIKPPDGFIGGIPGFYDDGIGGGYVDFTFCFAGTDAALPR